MSRDPVAFMRANAWLSAVRAAGFMSLMRALATKVVAVLILVAVLPLLSVAVAAIVCCGRHPLFRQARVGLNGATFQIWKLRTVDGSSPVWQVWSGQDRAFARLASWLRRTRIDELPQMLNIVFGDMNFVGPRPLMEVEFREMGSDGLMRQEVKPGLTGLAQLSGGNLLPLHAKLRVDLSYVAARSARLDAIILARTLPTLVRGIDGVPARLSTDGAKDGQAPG